MRSCWPLAVMLAACYGPRASAGAPCGPNGECPSGLDCIGGRCLPPGTPDAAVDDALDMIALDAPADAEASYVPWGTPIRLDSLETPDTGETDPSVTSNRLTAVLSAASPDEIYECTRPALTDSFTCMLATPLNSSAEDKSPEISADGTMLWFVSDRAGAYDVYTSTKTPAGWGTPTLVAELSTAREDQDVAVSPDGLTAVVNQDTAQNHLTLHTRASTTVSFGTGTVHTELEITDDIASPSVTNGGATIYFHAGVTRDLYVAYKKGNGLYTMPSPIAELNTVDRDASPFVTGDDKYMIFEHESDIFETTRP